MCFSYLGFKVNNSINKNIAIWDNLNLFPGIIVYQSKIEQLLNSRYTPGVDHAQFLDA
jgi:hypothetical protein